MTPPRPPRDPDDLADTLDEDGGIALAEVHDAPPRPLTPYDSAARRRALVESADTGELPTWDELQQHRRERTGPMPRLEAAALGSEPDHPAPMPRPPSWHVTPTDLRDSEWGRQMEARIAAHDARWRWTRRGLVALGPIALTALALALGWLRSSERAHGVAEEREAQRLEVRAAVIDLRDRVVPELRAAMAANSALIASLRGALDMLYRLSPVSGPPAPQFPPGDP